jgi:hypothetical protein
MPLSEENTSRSMNKPNAEYKMIQTVLNNTPTPREKKSEKQQ